MSKPSSVDAVLPSVLLGMTAVTGIVDAVSLLALGHVFTANMTGNLILLALASTGVPETSLPCSLGSLSAFLVGAALGGRMMGAPSADTQLRAATSAFRVEIAFLGGAALAAIGYNAAAPFHFYRLYGMIALTAIAMGIRNAVVRRLSVPDLTTTVLTMTVTGLASDSPLGHGDNPRWQRRTASIAAMFAGAALGAVVVRHSVFIALAFAVAAESLCSLVLLLATPISEGSK